MKSVRLYLSVTSVLLTMISNAQKPVDRLGAKGPFNFDNKEYNLTWSSHPSPNYYKQEYITSGDDINKFKSMLMVEVATGPIAVKNAVEAKVTELKTMKTSNPFISYDTFYNADKKEYILDFVITQNSPDNKSVVIAERNVYRYKTLPDKKGIMLFAVSVRSYGVETKTFLTNLKNGRKALVDKVKAYSLPDVKL